MTDRDPPPPLPPPPPFVPLPETIAFLYSLPLPPGVASQPQPASQQDWALVEQYRLLCQSLHVLAEYERARRAEGLPAVEWHDLALPAPPPPPPAPPRPAPPPPRPAVSSSHNNAVAQLSESLSSFPSSSFTFTSSGSLADGSLALDLSLPLDLDAESGPASLPSLMSAISELEHCVARLSLEANEARNLQRSLRTEMATRQSSSSASGGSAKKNGKKTAKPPPAAVAPAAAAPAPVVAAAERSSFYAAGTAPEQLEYERDLEHEYEQLQLQADAAVAHATALERRHDHHGPSSASGSGTGTGLGVKAWEDRELMKALESVSMLDKRADEYRERLKILKEQIHHHAALADALASQSSSPSNRSSKGAKNAPSRFGDVPS
ncbi:hypothetical protein JCM11491_005562, partial [Sporobolomyces phaffii]